jgi:hypothetical protein
MTAQIEWKLRNVRHMEMTTVLAQLAQRLYEQSEAERSPTPPYQQQEVNGEGD